MPHLMNCSHQDSGWCLECVSKLYNEKESNSNIISKKEIVELIKFFIQNKQSKICKHYVALELANLLENHDKSLGVDIIKAISDTDDERAICLLEDSN